MKLLLVGLTPRAGKRNHVFLVPQDTPEIRRRVEAVAETLEPRMRKLNLIPSTQQNIRTIFAPEMIVVWDVVQQVHTGRHGVEWLCLLPPPGTCFQIPPDKQIQVQQSLEAYFRLLQQKIVSHNWSARSDLFEVMETPLAQGQKEFQKILNRRWIHPVVPQTASGSGSHPTRKKLRLFLHPLLVLGFLIVLTIGCLFAHGCWDWIKRWREDSSKSWIPMAHTLGIQNPNGLSEREVFEQMRRKLLEIYDFRRTNDPEEDIRNVLNALDKIFGHSAGNESLDKLLTSQILREKLASLFPPENNYNFEPCGLTSWDHTTRDWLQGCDRGMLLQLLDAVSPASSEKKWELPGVYKWESDYKDDWEALWELAQWRHLQEWRKEPPRKFFLDSDKTIVDRLRRPLEQQYFQKICAEKTQLRSQIQSIVEHFQKTAPEYVDHFDKNLKEGDLNPQRKEKIQKHKDELQNFLNMMEKWKAVIEKGSGSLPLNTRGN